MGFLIILGFGAFALLEIVRYFITKKQEQDCARLPDREVIILKEGEHLQP